MSLPKTDERILFLHNPRCTKSRAALALLEARGAAVDVRRYLDEPLSAAELADLRKRLDRPAIEWVRRGEPEFKAAGLRPDSKDKDVLAASRRTRSCSSVRSPCVARVRPSAGRRTTCSLCSTSSAPPNRFRRGSRRCACAGAGSPSSIRSLLSRHASLFRETA